MKRWLCCLLVCLVVLLVPVSAFASEKDGLCEHHPVHENCGYEIGADNCNFLCDACAEAAGSEVSVDDGIMLESEPFSGSNVGQKSVYREGAMPCIGNPNVLVFYVTLPGSAQTWNLDRAGVEDMFFSETGESLRTYYEQSSYGKVHIEGTVYEYTTQRDVFYYTDATMIIDEIVEQYQDEINWNDYDNNHDGFVDGLYIVAKTDPIWDGANYVSEYPKTVGDISTSRYCLMLNQELSTLCHETCHMFGMPDVYIGTGMNPNGTNTSGIMDDGEGDIPGIMKLILGWIDNPIYISGEGTTDLSLKSISTNGELVIVHPNGDTENNNWMILEYLTNEANNRYSGVRIWKTNVVLDESSNIVDFRYLEAISPWNKTNYYFGKGENVTPYTYPSTSYGITYRSDGGFMTTNSYFDQIGFSGISISVNDVNGEYAELTVTIDNTIKDVEGEAVVILPTSASDIITDSTRMLIATVESKQELMLSDKIFLTDTFSGTSIPVETVWNDYSNILSLYVSGENAASLESNKSYQINLNDTVKTYYGSNVVLKDFDGVIQISNLGIAIPAAGPYETPYFGLADFYAPDAFRIDSTHVMHFGYLNNVLFMRTHDITTQQYTDVTVTLNPPPGLLQIDKVLLIDEKYCAVLFRNDLDERIIKHIAVYDLDGQLVDESTPTNRIIYVGGNGHPVVVEDDYIESKAKEIKVLNDQLVFETINYPFRLWDATKASQYKLTDSLFAYADREYVPTAHTTVTLLAASGKILSTLEFDNVRDIDLVYRNNKLYALTVGQDLTLYVYDSNFSLVEKRVLMQQLNKGTIWELKLGIIGESFWVSFYATPTADAEDYYNSYLLVFTPNMLPQYYRYCDVSATAVCNFVYVGHGTFFAGTQTPYYLLKVEVGDHDYTYDCSVVAPTCTENGYTIHTCACGDSYVAEITAPIPHSWSNGSCDEPRTCTVCGESSGKDGHIYDDGVDGICNICGIDRVTTKKRQVHHMLRMYNPNTGEHFYTGSEVERDNLIAAGWNYEGVAFTFPANTGAPVYRLFEPATGEHLYTMDEAEKDLLLSKGWNYEGIAFNSAYDTEAVQHRLHNPNAIVGAYHFTFSEEEKQNLIDAGWEYQGIGWYSCWK